MKAVRLMKRQVLSRPAVNKLHVAGKGERKRERERERDRETEGGGEGEQSTLT